MAGVVAAFTDYASRDIDSAAEFIADVDIQHREIPELRLYRIGNRVISPAQNPILDINPAGESQTRRNHAELGIFGNVRGRGAIFPPADCVIGGGYVSQRANLGIPNCERGERSGGVVVDSLGGESGVPAEEAEAAGADAAESVAASGDGVEGGVGQDWGKEAAVAPALDLLRGDGADGDGGAVDDGHCAAQCMGGGRRVAGGEED